MAAPESLSGLPPDAKGASSGRSSAPVSSGDAGGSPSGGAADSVAGAARTVEFTAPPAGSLVPEEVIADRYVVKRRLGAGGMGEAWLAEDRVLHRKLVLKRLTGTHAGSQSGDTPRAGQLLREAKRATAIDSPHIAQVFDVCSHRGEWLLAMEYVAGRNLRAVLHEPLDAAAYFALALQIAEAIAAAHASGVLHCDIKPENIMVTEQGFVKVLDFGLARVMARAGVDHETVSTSTGTGLFAGTPGYLAPEVLREGEPTERSDVFALGVVLYEMAGGQAPFKGKSLADSVQMTLAAEPSALDLKERGLPADLNRVLKKALMKDPEQRCATVGDLLAELKALEEKRRLGRGRGSGLRPGQAAVAGGIGIILLIALAAGLVLARHGHRAVQPATAVPAAARTRLLAVLPFAILAPGDAGSQAGMSAYSEGLRDAITTSLARVASSARIEVLAASEVRAHGLKTPDQARKELGADLVIDGSYQQYRNQVRILYSLIDASGTVLRSGSVTNTLRDPFRLEDDVVNGVLQMLSVSAAPGKEEPERFGTRVPAAYDAYLRAVGYLRDYDLPDNLKKAMRSFEAATHADPEFAAAYAGLGQTHWAEYEATSNAAEIEQARTSCRKAMDLNNQVAEAQICQATIDDGTGQVKQAQQEYETALRLDPQSDTALNGLARTWEEMERPDQAKQVYQQAIQARPFYWANYFALANFLVRRADYRQAASVLEQAVEILPANSFLARRLGVVYFLEGQFDQAAAVLQKAIGELPHAEAYMDLGQVELHRRQFGPAIAALEQAARMSPNSYSVQADLADAYAWSGTQKDKAEARYRRALELSDASLHVNPGDLDALMVSAYCSAALGRRGDALRYLDGALRHAPQDAEVNYYAARVYARLGDTTAARDWVQKAVAHGYSKADVDSAPDLESLDGGIPVG